MLAALLVAGSVIFSAFGETLVAIVSPVWQANNAVTRRLTVVAEFFTSKTALVEENIALKERVSNLETELLAATSQLAQSGMFLELAGRREEMGGLIAAVLVRPPRTLYDVLVIDAGTDESLAIGSKVFLPEGPALGAVAELSSRTAKVRLFSSAGDETPAAFERGGSPVTLVGMGGGAFRITAPRDVDVEPGDRIISAEVPSRLLAIVEDVSLNSTDSFKEVLARTPASMFDVRFVLVIP